jgi:PAS domain-containing protein
MADDRPTEVERQLHLVLDSIPGALAYTDDDMKIVFCNDRFKEMYKVPQELLQPGRPYADLLRYAAENGYYGEGDVDASRASTARFPPTTSWQFDRKARDNSSDRPRAHTRTNSLPLLGSTTYW